MTRAPAPLIAVIDDDESVRESLPDLLREFGYQVEAFSSAPEFLASGCLARAMCLIVDVAMPRMSGGELQREARRLGYATPIIFITAQSDVTIRSRVIAEGAVECLFKPFSSSSLQEALDAARLRV
jgi:FixJ family two-component response regulator